MWPELRFWVPGSWHVVVASHAVAVFIAVGVGLWWAGRAGGPAARLIGAVTAVAGLVGAQFAFAVLAGVAPEGGWSGGLTSMGGIVAGLAAAAATARMLGVPVAAAFDAIVPAGLLALAIGRVGCFLGGCCYGRVSDLPWAVVLARVGAEPRHPLQLYSAAADLALVATVGRTVGAPGRRACATLAGFAVARIALETLRDPAATDRIGPVTMAQMVCATLLVAACLAAARQGKSPKSA